MYNSQGGAQEIEQYWSWSRSTPKVMSNRLTWEVI